MRALFVIFSALLWVFSTSGAADAQTPVKYLDWPGKAQPKPAASMAPAEAAPVAEPVAAAEPVVAVSVPPQTFAPKSIYDAPPPAAATAATPAVAMVASAEPATGAASARSRRYSLLRDYGEQPDPVALPAPVYLDHLPVDTAHKAEKASKQAKDDAAKESDSSDDDSDGGPA